MDGVRASSFCEYKARHAARAVARCAIGAGIASVLGRHFGLSKANVRAPYTGRLFGSIGYGFQYTDRSRTVLA
jgi:hypothetical protein